MKINTICVDGFKNQKFSQKLTGKDLIIGNNGLGKSSRLESIALSILGYIPGDLKKADEIFFNYTSQNKMEVGIELDTGFKIKRSFSKKETKSRTTGEVSLKVQQDIRVSPNKGENRLTEKEGRIIAELGSFPVMLDFNEFSSLTDNKKREFIYSLCGFENENWSKEKVKEYLENNLLTTELKIENEDVFELMKETIEKVLMEWIEGVDVVENVQHLGEFVKSEVSGWNAEKDRSIAAAQKFTELKNKANETERNLTTNETTLEDLQKKLLEVEKQITESEERKKSFDKKQEKISNIIKEIETEKLKEDTADKKQLMNDLLNSEKELKGLQELENQESVDKDEAVKMELKNNQNKIAVINKIIDKKIIESIKITSLIEGKESIIKGIEDNKNSCVIDKRINCNKDFSKFIDFETTVINKLKIDKTNTKKEINEKQNEINSLTQNIDNINKKIEKANSKKKENDIKEKKLNQKISQLKVDINNSDNFEKNKVEKTKQLEKELENLKNEKTEAIAPIGILKAQADGHRKSISDLKIKIKEQQDVVSKLVSFKQSLIDSKKAKNNHQCFKEIDEKIGMKGLQGQIIKETLDPLKNLIQENINLMKLDWEFFFKTENKNGKEIFRFGVSINEEKRNFEGLSTGQQLIVLIAIVTAFIEKSNTSLRILAIDKIEHLDKDKIENLLIGLNEMSGSKLDNIILAGVIDQRLLDDMEISKEFNICDLNKLETVKNKKFSHSGVVLIEEGELDEKTA